MKILSPAFKRAYKHCHWDLYSRKIQTVLIDATRVICNKCYAAGDFEMLF